MVNYPTPKGGGFATFGKKPLTCFRKYLEDRTCDFYMISSNVFENKFILKPKDQDIVYVLNYDGTVVKDVAPNFSNYKKINLYLR